MGILESIRTEIERRKNNAETIRERSAYIGLLAFLDTLPEQPASEEKFRNFLDAAGDCGFSQDDILLLTSLWNDENAADEKVVKKLSEKVSSEITRQVKDAIISEGLEEEISSYWNRVTGFQPKFAVLELTKDDLAKVAHHFYELGKNARKEE